MYSQWPSTHVFRRLKETKSDTVFDMCSDYNNISTKKKEINMIVCLSHITHKN